MSEHELETLVDLLEKFIQKERVELTQSERLAVIKLANAADLLAQNKHRRCVGAG